jgi:hypothetical protein
MLRASSIDALTLRLKEALAGLLASSIVRQIRANVTGVGRPLVRVVTAPIICQYATRTYLFGPDRG